MSTQKRIADPKFDYGRFPTRDRNGNLRNLIEPVGRNAHLAHEEVSPNAICKSCLRDGRELTHGFYWASSSHDKCVRCVMADEEKDRAAAKAERSKHRKPQPKEPKTP
jgi:hypothetical protein